MTLTSWFRNLLPAAEVQACLKVLPGLYGADACKSDFLSSVAFATNDDALQTEAVAAMISVAWQQMRGTTALDIGLGFLTLAFLIYTSYAHRNAQPLCGAYAVRSSLVFEHCNHCVDLVTADSFMAHILLHPVASSNILPPAHFTKTYLCRIHVAISASLNWQTVSFLRSVECLCAAAVLHAKTSIEEMRDIERERERETEKITIKQTEAESESERE